MPAHSTATTIPYWTDSSSLPRFGKLDRDLTVDVVVVGAGIAGLTAAYLIAKAGRSVAVLERDRCSLGDTGHTSAHLTMVTDLHLTDIAKTFGRNHAQAVWDAGLASIAQIDEIARGEAIDCGFAWVPGYLYPAADDPVDRAVDAFREEAALARDLGFDASTVDAVPFIGRPGIRFENQARFHPRQYLAGLAQAVEARGGQIFEHTSADTFNDSPRSVEANGHTVRCDAIVLATHNPLVGVSNMPGATLLQTKLALYTSYVVAGRVESGVVPDALFWDTGDPYHYLRVETHRGFDVVIFGGEDHKTGQVDDTRQCFDRLETALREMVPGIETTHRWSGQVIETPDGLPYIGETAERQFAATGFSGNGMTFGTLAGMMATDYVIGRANPWSELFDPSRKKIRGAAWNYVKENKDYPYYMVRDRFAGAEGRSLRAVKPGEGRILELDGTRVAVFRDDSGATDQVSPMCTHMGCEVAWNSAEHTWDCPCHGSRFRTDGSVISGPAESPLEQHEYEPKAHGGQ